MISLLAFLVALPVGQMPMVNESARQIPVAYQVDVVVVGGSTGAVAAAVTVAKAGAKVFLAAPRAYLGDDMTATLRLWLEDGQTPIDPLAKQIFSDQAPAPRPMHIKKTLDAALLEAGVEFLYSCYPTDVLRDAQGNPCGIVMANRAGRQAVVARTMIDATERSAVARLAGAKFRPYPAGVRTFQRVVIGGEARQADNVASRTVSPPFRASAGKGGQPGREVPIIEYTVRLPMKDGSYASWAEADQQARTLTYHPDQQFTSDQLFEVPPDPVHGRASADASWQGVSKLPLEAFQPSGTPRLYVLGGCADVSREQAKELLRPLALIDAGRRIGAAAAAEAKSLPAPQGVRLPGKTVTQPAAEGDVREVLVGVRPIQQLPTIPQDARALAVLGQYDVLVIGGGTAGAPAGIGAARQGARTLVAECLHALGGVGTVGTITAYYSGNRVGFTATVMPETLKKNAWRIEPKMEWWRSTLRDAGADIWFGAIGCGALVHKGRVLGAVVATPEGRGVVLAKAVIDATGSADVAAAAGAKCLYTDHSEFAMQGTGIPARRLGDRSANSDFTLTDDTDLVDFWHLLVYAKHKYADAFDLGQLVDTRERRRIVGDFTITLLDQVNERTYPDTVVQAMGGPFDSHGFTIDPFLLVARPKMEKVPINVPYRSMLPQGLEGILVVGLAISAHRDAVPMIRMQPDIQNGGYAAGVAASMAAKPGTLVRNIDVRALQEHLVKIGNLTERVLSDKDSYPLPRAKVVDAVARIKSDPVAAAVAMTEPKHALPLLREAYAAAQGNDKSVYAVVLAVMGDRTGVETLLAEVRAATQWDAGWNYRGMGQRHVGTDLSPLDVKIVALGRAGDRRAVPAILEKLRLLSAQSAFSHHRAVGLALELLGDPAAARPLAELLTKPDMAGYIHDSLETAVQREVPGGTTGVQTRRESLRELLLARALYRCGDCGGLGAKILRAYTADLRGHLARHAQAVLKAGSQK